MPPASTYTISLTGEQIVRLREVLEGKGFEFRSVEYAHFGAAREKVQLVAYLSGKCVIQGKGTGEFIEFVLEPEVTCAAKHGYETVLNPERFRTHIGIDESGKGDFFGPMVVAGVFATARAIGELAKLGVRDSKSISSHARIVELAKAIRGTSGVDTEIVAISPKRYNELQAKMGSVNELLAWGHAHVLEQLLTRNPCQEAVSDQFARSKQTIIRHLKTLGRGVNLHQMHKAEADPVVAAASILAREKFVGAIQALSSAFGIKVPLGCSSGVRQCAADLIQKHGAPRVAEAVKTHFRTWAQINGLPLGDLDTRAS